MNAYPLTAENVLEEPPNPEAYIPVPEEKDWLDEDGDTPEQKHPFEGTGRFCSTCGKV